jgi:hypothetical protein
LHARVSEDDGWYTTRGLDPNIRPYLNEALDKCTYLRERGHEAIQYLDTENYRVARCGVDTYAGQEKAPSPAPSGGRSASTCETSRSGRQDAHGRSGPPRQPQAADTQHPGGDAAAGCCAGLGRVARDQPQGGGEKAHQAGESGALAECAHGQSLGSSSPAVSGIVGRRHNDSPSERGRANRFPLVAEPSRTSTPKSPARRKIPPPPGPRPAGKAEPSQCRRDDVKHP